MEREWSVKAGVEETTEAPDLFTLSGTVIRLSVAIESVQMRVDRVAKHLHELGVVISRPEALVDERENYDTPPLSPVVQNIEKSIEALHKIETELEILSYSLDK